MNTYVPLIKVIDAPHDLEINDLPNFDNLKILDTGVTVYKSRSFLDEPFTQSQSRRHSHPP